MTRSIALVCAWLAIGHAVWAGLYWLLLHVPESNVFMLGTSLLLVLLLVWWLGAVEAVGLLASAPGATLRASIGPAAKRAWMIVVPAVVFGAVWMVTAHARAWLATHGSEIDAWIILKTGWTNGNYLTRAADHVVAFVRWVVGLSLAATLFAAMLRGHASAAVSIAWVKQACHWKQLLFVAGALALVTVPSSHLLDWRWVPAGKAGTWVEPALASVKLGVIYLGANAVWACVLRFIVRDPPTIASQ